MSTTVEFAAVTVRVGRRELVRDVSLRIEPGEMVGIVGPNGAGKTTLLRTLYRAQRPTSGRVLVGGDDVWVLPGRQAARRLAAVLQDSTGDFELTVYDVVAMGRTPYKRAFEGDNADDRRIVMDALTAVDMAALAGEPYNRLSGGQKQRVMIARALAQQTGVIVLDEPTNHLDLRHQHEALHLLRRTGATVVAVLHDLNLAAAYCDRICVMDAGAVVAVGEPAEVLTERLIAEVYQVSARVIVDDRVRVDVIPGVLR
ncbi:ABC transporter ATP-binding protein [Mycolicibacterium phlei]|uniref:ABC transporter ATP-binding protein n=1 Tax=Mycolicibacterium phlei DSM 43239 = CCUG 21000 TaxID=1226750 RepID=A0A5N5VB03_MYCPH|nr:ABC transporter ATP-binding protein [Mycolicibacterium phlei]VEG07446.1 ABC transporter ATP-binding protein [Mycobacteroides chelonae]AMO59314.1 Hemin import ATP-binding protein HmuV [Mycolicibacterium phlei]EID13722.1 Fe uptake system permease [Mycolicibacterium phlei RIVM601174]KAB7758958.1 ABC transporter ATP-binding protein [Mycolicibacterium phlei DSM 43239 = CCUG 21000]KXW59830.1 ABC transporter ATP-binding protein [Mycolicibacterium phlei DSM 43072]